MGEGSKLLFGVKQGKLFDISLSQESTKLELSVKLLIISLVQRRRRLRLLRFYTVLSYLKTFGRLAHGWWNCLVPEEERMVSHNPLPHGIFMKMANVL